MAKIPYSPDPNVTTEPLPTPYQRPFATPEGEGAGFANVLDHGARVAEMYAQDATARANVAAVQGATAKSRAALNSVILDDQGGYSSLRGADAMAGRQKALTAFGKAVDDASAELTPDQRRMFEPKAVELHNRAISHVIQHETVEQERYSQAQYRGNVDQTMVTLEKVIADPAAVGQQVDALFQAGIEEARRRYGQNASKDAISSVVVPELQKAALGGMEAAIATQDPATARTALDRLGKYMVTNHQRFYAGAVQAMEAKQTIAAQTARIMAASSDSVPVPGGSVVARVDGTKVAEASAALPPETPHLAEILKAVDQQEKVRNDLWSKSAAKVFERVHSAGQDPITGDFDLQNPKISAADKAWLNRFAPGELDKLRALDKRSTVQDKAATHEASLEALSQLSSDMHDPQSWAATYAKMTSGQFLTLITSPQFADLAGPERLRAQRLFDANKAADSKLEEPIGRTVKAQIAEVFPGDERAVQRKKFSDQYFEALRAAAQTYVNSEKAAGRKVDSEAVAKFLDGQLAKVPSGSWYIRDKRQIEINAAAALQPPAAPPPTAAATPVAPPPTPGRITVRNAAGKAFTLPPEQVDEFLKSPEGKGFSR